MLGARCWSSTMTTFLKFVVLLSLIIWVGGIIFFSFVVAPAVFGILMPVTGGQHMAGDIVSKSLFVLHSLGLVCGVVFLICLSAVRKGFRQAANYVVFAMLLLTSVSQFLVTPRIRSLRWDLVERETVEARTQFDHLHSLSVRLEGAVLLLGL